MDPWGSDDVADYDRLQEEFGIEPFHEAADLPDPPPIFRREVVFGQRGWSRIQRAIDAGDDWAVMTGLMPSGPMHVGHKMVIDQVAYYQELGADVVVGVADLEAYWTRDMDLDEAKELAIEEYIKNYIAMGLDPDSTRVYFQSENDLVREIADDLARHVNLSTMRSIYGFDDETDLGHMMAPLVQVGDILHVQDEGWGGPRPTVVPVGVDQDPHLRLTRDLAARSRIYNVQLTDEGRVGVFVTPDDDVDRYLDAARDALQDQGYLDVEANPEYKALYLPGAADSDVEPIDEALARIEPDLGGTGYIAPAATYHRFMTGLTGGKMSSSEPDSAIFLKDTPEEAQGKVDRAKTGGRATAAEQREKGANPDDCMIYEMFLYHLVDDDDQLATIYQESQDGDRLCGHCKSLARDRVTEMLQDLKAGRDEAEDQLDAFLQHPEARP